MSGTPGKTGPVALTTTLTTNIHNGGGGSAALRDRIKHIHITNKTDAVAKVSLWIGATGANAAGTELFSARSIDGRKELEYYCDTPLTSADFIVGGSDTATALTILIEYERSVI